MTSPTSHSFPNGAPIARSEREARRDRAIARLVETARMEGRPASEILAAVADTRRAFAMSDLINSLGGVR